jgi:flagellar M-ring protein FliF
MDLQQIMNVWTALEMRQRVIVGLAGVAMFIAVFALARTATSPSLSLLYAGMESGPAGEVVTALEQRGVAYDVRGGAIFVDSARRDELRMTLASEGLPASSAKGYELLDGLSGFGTTSQMFDAAYWRAKEGELARTIVAHPTITSARVHIANSGTNPFQRDVKSSASVSLNTASGNVSAKHARALKFLVASAVPGLLPEDVSIIDGAGNLVGLAEEAPSTSTEDRAETLRSRVQRLLEARVGPGNAVVEVSVDTVTRSESMRERVIDPSSRVAISTDTEEVSNASSDAGGGDVTVASNLPDGDGAGGDTSSSTTSETRERVNYEVSQTEREVTVAPGAIKRLTVAVLVNGLATVDSAEAATFEPRSQEELDALRELVASAVGFDEARGDVITIKTMAFEPASALGTAAEAGLLSGLNLNATSVIKAAILALVALILGLFVIRPVLTAPRREEIPQLAMPEGRPADTQPVTEALTGEIDEGDGPTDAAQLTASADTLPALQQSQKDPVDRLRAMIDDRQEETVEILRSWLEGEEEKV